jgi:hypothetical protein
MIMISNALSGYGEELFIFAGPIVLAGMIMSLTAKNTKESRETGGNIVFFVSLASIVVHMYIYGGPQYAAIKHREVVAACFVEGLLLSLLVYYIKTRNYPLNIHELQP